MIGALHALAAVLAYVDPGAEQVAKDTQEILGDQRYDFCHAESRFWPYEEERAWCDLIERDDERCPDYVELCERDFATSGSGGVTPEKPPPTQRRDAKGIFNKDAGGDDPKPPASVQINPGMSAFSQLLLWALAIGGVLLLLWTIARSSATGREVDESPQRDEKRPPRQLLPGDAARRQIETDVTRLLERARQAAGRGSYRDAIDDVYAALLRRLDGDGLIEIHEARTNGDYVRALRTHPEVRAEVRTIVRDVERVQFGDSPPDEPIFRRLLDRVTPLVSRQLGALLILFALGSSGCDGGIDDEQGGLAGLGTGPDGGRAVVQLLRRQNITAHHRTRTVEQLGQNKGALLLFGDVEPTSEEWKTLLDWTRDGGTLLVATGHDDLPRELDIEVEYAPNLTTDRADLAFADGSEYRYGDLAVRLPRQAYLEVDHDDFRLDRILVRPQDEENEDEDSYVDVYEDGYAEVYAARLNLDEGRVIVFADSRLFSNASLAVADNAAFLVELFADFEGEVEVIDEWTGSGAQTPLDSISNSHLTPVILQILAFMSLLYLWRGIAFGRMRDPSTGGRRAFVDHVHALALQYSKARASRHVLSMYATWVLDRLRHRVAPGTGRTLHGLATAVASRTGRDQGEVMRLLVEAHTVREAAAHQSGIHGARRQDLALMRELTRLLSDATRARKKR